VTITDAERRAGTRSHPPPQTTRVILWQALTLVAEGLSNRQIADRVFLAEKTVKNYASSILMKLGLARRTEAVAMVGQLRWNNNTGACARPKRGRKADPFRKPKV